MRWPETCGLIDLMKAERSGLTVVAASGLDAAVPAHSVARYAGPTCCRPVKKCPNTDGRGLSRSVKDCRCGHACHPTWESGQAVRHNAVRTPCPIPAVEGTPSLRRWSTGMS